MTEKAHIALIPAVGIGDALIALVLANNLHLNGYRVSVFHKLIHHFNDWFPDFDIQPMPKPEQALQTFKQFDLTISIEPCSSYDYDISLFAALGHQHIAIRMEEDVDVYADLNQKTRNMQHPIASLTPFLKASGNVFTQIDPQASLVESFAHLSRESLKLGQHSHMPNLKRPRHNPLRKKNKTIIIHPDASYYKKNWSPKKFMQLAARLQKDGYHCIFAVSPHENPHWQPIINGQFTLTQWTLPELAENIYNACLFIGNCSGPGHLASMLGVPTITVYPRTHSNYRWKPAWAPSYIAAPSIPMNFIKGKHHLRSFLTTNKVYKIAKKALHETDLS